MTRTVSKFMNRELLGASPDTLAREALRLLREFAVGAMPVLDDERRPIGMVSLRDVAGRDEAVRDCMSKPAICVTESTSVDAAARRLAAMNRHHLVVVDGAGVAIGIVSTLDLLRALLGMPPHHPAMFPHWDETTEVSWTDDWPLDEGNCARAPAAPGVLVLVSDAFGKSDVVWAEPCADVRQRASELLLSAAAREPALARVLSVPGVRFRAAEVRDESSRHRVAALLRDRLAHVPPPGGT